MVPTGEKPLDADATGLPSVNRRMTTELIAKRPWQRRLDVRLSIRGLIALVFLFGGGLGWWLHLARVQREAVAHLSRRGLNVDY